MSKKNTIQKDSLLVLIVDDVLDEPLIGAHRDKQTAADVVKAYFLQTVKDLRTLSEDEMLDQRYKRLTAVGAYSE